MSDLPEIGNGWALALIDDTAKAYNWSFCEIFCERPACQLWALWRVRHADSTPSFGEEEMIDGNPDGLRNFLRQIAADAPPLAREGGPA